MNLQSTLLSAFQDGAAEASTRSSYVRHLLNGLSTSRLIAGLIVALLLFTVVLPIIVSLIRRCWAHKRTPPNDLENLVADPAEEEADDVPAENDSEVESV